MKKITVIKLLLPIAMIGVITPSHANETTGNKLVIATLTEEDFFAEIPIVLTATRLAQPINEAPASMTIIDRQMIEASGAREIVDVFRLIPGFQVQHDNGHTPIVSYHGMSDQYARWMQVLVDGRSIYNPSVGGVEWSHIPLVLDEIERIEVTRGPNAASYGSNAFSATINIITRHASETTGTFFRYTRGTPNGVNDAILRFGHTVNSKTGDLSYRLTLGRLTDDGFTDRYDLKRANLGRFRLDYSANATDTWLFQAGFNNGPRGLDSGDPGEFPERNREKEIEYQFQQLRWTHSLSNREELQIQYFHNHHKVDETEEYDLTAEEFGLDPDDPAQAPFIALYNTDPVHFALYNSLTTDRHDLEIQHTLVPNNDWRIVWGGSIRQDQWYAPGIIASDSTVKIDLLRAFANTEWRATNDFTVNAGAMWEDGELTEKNVSPRLGLQYRIDNNHNIRIVTSRATRIPTMTEYAGKIVVNLTGDFLNLVPPAFGGPFPNPSYVNFLLGTKDLDHETITSFEIGLSSHRADIGLSTDIKIYQDKISDIIFFNTVPNPTADIPNTTMIVPENGEDVTIRGIEAQADIKPYTGSRIFISYAYTDIDSDDDFKDYSETAPARSFSLLLSQRFQNDINASFAFYKTSEHEGLENGDPITSQSRADFRLSIPFQKNKFRGEIAFVSQNISGMELIDWREDNRMERRQLITITGQWD